MNYKKAGDDCVRHYRETGNCLLIIAASHLYQLHQTRTELAVKANELRKAIHELDIQDQLPRIRSATRKARQSLTLQYINSHFFFVN